MVDGHQQHGFNQLCLHERTPYAYDRFSREYGATFPDRPDIAGKFKMPEIVKECFAESIQAAKVIQIFFAETKVLQIMNQLLNAGHDGVAAAIRNVTEKEVKVGSRLLKSPAEITIGHGQFVKIRQHRDITSCQPVIFAHTQTASDRKPPPLKWQRLDINLCL